MIAWSQPHPCLILPEVHFSLREEAPLRGGFRCGLEFYHIDCFGALRALFDIKADLLTFGKTLEAIALDGRMVDKDIAAVFTGNEAKALAVVEPLHSSLCHFMYLLLCKLNLRRPKQTKGHKVKSLWGLL